MYEFIMKFSITYIYPLVSGILLAMLFNRYIMSKDETVYNFIVKKIHILFFIVLFLVISDVLIYNTLISSFLVFFVWLTIGIQSGVTSHAKKLNKAKRLEEISKIDTDIKKLFNN